MRVSLIKLLGFLFFGVACAILMIALGLRWWAISEAECALVADIAPPLAEKAVNPILRPQISMGGRPKPEAPKDCSRYFQYRGLSRISSPDAVGADVARYSQPVIYEPRRAVVGVSHSLCNFMLDVERRRSKWVVVKEGKPLCF